MNRVVITGIGLVTPNGIGTETTWRSVLAGESGIGPITLFDASQYPVRIAGEVKGFVADAFIPRRRVREMGRFAHLSVAASALCLQDAAIDLTDEDRDQCGTLIGVGLGGTEALYQSAVILHEKGPRRISPYFIPTVIANLAAGQVAMTLGLRGVSYSNTSACTSSAHSIGEAFEWIRRGRSPLMVAGGAEATISGLSIAGFAAMHALSHRNDEPGKASRPWDRARDGFVCGEGAATLLLESLEHATRRGAKIYAEVTGYGATADAYHITKPAPDGAGAQRAMRLAIADAKRNPEDVDYINAHGTSTVQGDIEEANAIAAVFGAHATEHRLWVSSTKSVTGHLLGASGALEAAIAALSLRDGRVAPTANLDELDPQCLLDCVPLCGREKALRHVLSNSFGFGGTNVSLLFSKFEG